jgi:hypothetical protein
MEKVITNKKYLKMYIKANKKSLEIFIMEK